MAAHSWIEQAGESSGAGQVTASEAKGMKEMDVASDMPSRSSDDGGVHGVRASNTGSASRAEAWQGVDSLPGAEPSAASGSNARHHAHRDSKRKTTKSNTWSSSKPPVDGASGKADAVGDKPRLQSNPASCRVFVRRRRQQESTGREEGRRADGGDAAVGGTIAGQHRGLLQASCMEERGCAVVLLKGQFADAAALSHAGLAMAGTASEQLVSGGEDAVRSPALLRFPLALLRHLKNPPRSSC